MPDETIEGPDPTSQKQPTAQPWYENLGPTEPAAESKPTAETKKDGETVGLLLAGAIAVAHDKAADLTGWEGWRMNDTERSWWAQCFGFLLRDADVKNARIYVVLTMIVISEGSRVAGYVSYRKQIGKPLGVRPKRVEPDEAPPATDNPAPLARRRGRPRKETPAPQPPQGAIDPHEIFNLTKPHA